MFSRRDTGSQALGGWEESRGAETASGGGRGGGGGSTARFDEDRRVVPGVTWGIHVEGKKRARNGFIYCLALKNVYSVLYLAGEEQYAALQQCFPLVQWLADVHDTKKGYNNT